MGPYFDFVKILLGEEVCSQALGSRSLKLQASREPVEAPASKECFTSFSLVAKKALWHSSTLSYLLCFIFDNPLPVRILGGSYKWIVFPRQSFHDRKVGSSFQVGVGTMHTSGLSLVFKFLPLYR